MAKKEKPYSGRSGAAARASGRNVDRPDIQARKSAEIGPFAKKHIMSGQKLHLEIAHRDIILYCS